MISTQFARIKDKRLGPVVDDFEIYTTLEGENPGGSIKDRMVEAELQCLMNRGRLNPGDVVSEISAGSTARSLAYYCNMLNLRCVLFVPDHLPRSFLEQLRQLNAELKVVPLEGAFEQYDQYVASTKVHKFDQFGNHCLRKHYRPLGLEIRTLGITHIIGAVGTGHSLQGVCEFIGEDVQTYTAEPTMGKKVLGIRNIQAENFGERDPFDASSFERIEVPEEDFFPLSEVETDQGLIGFSDSFRVVLGALKQMPLAGVGKIFLLGADNHKCS